MVLCVIVGKHNSSNAEFQGSVAFAGQGNEKIVGQDYCCIQRNELLTAPTYRVYNITYPPQKYESFCYTDPRTCHNTPAPKFSMLNIMVNKQNNIWVNAVVVVQRIKLYTLYTNNVTCIIQYRPVSNKASLFSWNASSWTWLSVTAPDVLLLPLFIRSKVCSFAQR